MAFHENMALIDLLVNWRLILLPLAHTYRMELASCHQAVQVVVLFLKLLIPFDVIRIHIQHILFSFQIKDFNVIGTLNSLIASRHRLSFVP